MESGNQAHEGNAGYLCPTCGAPISLGDDCPTCGADAAPSTAAPIFDVTRAHSGTEEGFLFYVTRNGVILRAMGGTADEDTARDTARRIAACGAVGADSLGVRDALIAAVRAGALGDGATFEPTARNAFSVRTADGAPILTVEIRYGGSLGRDAERVTSRV